MSQERKPSGDKAKGRYAPDPTVPIGKDTPPMFFSAADDGDKVDIATCIHDALKDAGVRSELKTYPKGGHDFGLRPGPCAGWTQVCEEWLKKLDFLKPAAK